MKIVLNMNPPNHWRFLRQSSIVWQLDAFVKACKLQIKRPKVKKMMLSLEFQSENSETFYL